MNKLGGVYRDYFKNLEDISQKNDDDDLFYACLHCRYQVRALEIIRIRYNDDAQIFVDLVRKQNEVMDKIPARQLITPSDKIVLQEYNAMLEQLRLDIETYIIYSRALMDKIALTAWLVIRDAQLSHRSFSDQKDWLKKPVNIPYMKNESYASLVRDRTNWFNIGLKFVRDKFVVHAFPRMLSYKVDAIGNIQINLMELAGSKEDAELLAEIKRRYISRVPGLNLISDNMWEILHYFQNNDIDLDENDVNRINEIRLRNGTDLLELKYIERKIFEFLYEFEEIFIL